MILKFFAIQKFFEKITLEPKHFLWYNVCMKNFEKDTQSTTQKLQILFDTFCKLQTELGVTFSLEATEDETLEAYRKAFKQKYLQQKFFEKLLKFLILTTNQKLFQKTFMTKLMVLHLTI